MSQFVQAQDHWAHVDALVKRWLQDRQKLIVLMLSLNTRDSSHDAHAQPLSERIQTFCQSLVDYVSAGHFEVYDRLLSEGESDGNPALLKAQKSYGILYDSTQAALRFNDVYDCHKHSNDLIDNLPHELAEISLMLEDRFEAEDRLIAMLHKEQPHIALDVPVQDSKQPTPAVTYQ